MTRRRGSNVKMQDQSWDAESADDESSAHELVADPETRESGWRRVPRLIDAHLAGQITARDELARERGFVEDALISRYASYVMRWFVKPLQLIK